MLGCLLLNDQSEMRPTIIQIKHPYLIELICQNVEHMPGVPVGPKQISP